jgi:hypothetical protein
MEQSLVKLSGIIHQQATVIAEAVYGIQLLIKKGIITREELKDVREALVNADSILSPTVGVQPEEAGSDGDSGGSGERGLPGGSSDRGNLDCTAAESGRASGAIPQESDESDSDPSVGSGKIIKLNQ